MTQNSAGNDVAPGFLEQRLRRRRLAVVLGAVGLEGERIFIFSGGVVDAEHHQVDRAVLACAVQHRHFVAIVKNVVSGLVLVAESGQKLAEPRPLTFNASVVPALPRKLTAELQMVPRPRSTPSRHRRETAFDWFLKTYDGKYPKATHCLLKDREELLAFYDFPAEHWVHLRTTNPIESTFATIRHRTARTKGCVSRNTMLAMIFKLGTCAQRRWRRLRGFRHIAKVIRDVRFVDGIEQTEDADHNRNAA